MASVSFKQIGTTQRKQLKKCARYAVKNTGEIESRLYLGCERSSQNLKARASLKHWKKEASRRA